MSKKTTIKTSKPTKAATEPNSNDKARADALAKLNAKPDAAAKDATETPTAAKDATPAKATRNAKAAKGSPTGERGAKGGKVAKGGKDAKPKPAKPAKAKRISAIDAAAKVLAESDRPLRAIDMIEVMHARGLWTSPGGKTPEATLYAAITREITAKGKDARFKKVDRGMFTSAPTSTAAAKAGKGG